MTHFHIVPEAGAGIVILTNSQRSWSFLAIILDEWAGWNGFGSVRMGRITTANRLVAVLFGVFLIAALWVAARLILGLIGGRKRFAPLARTGRNGRLLQAAAGLAIIGWGTATLVFFGIILIVSALFPRYQSPQKDS